MKLMFDENDYTPLKGDEVLTDKYVIINPDKVKPEYREAKHLLFLAKDGFGCEPNKLGTKIFGGFINSHAYMRRESVLGIAKEEAIVSWEKAYGVDRSILQKNYEEN